MKTVVRHIGVSGLFILIINVWIFGHAMISPRLHENSTLHVFYVQCTMFVTYSECTEIIGDTKTVTRSLTSPNWHEGGRP